LRVGLNIVDLRRAPMAGSTHAARDGRDAGPACRWRSAAMPVGRCRPSCSRTCDLALTEAMTESRDYVREDALIGLVGIRRGLFPDAPACQAKTPDPINLQGLAA